MATHGGKDSLALSVERRAKQKDGQESQKAGLLPQEGHEATDGNLADI